MTSNIQPEVFSDEIEFVADQSDRNYGSSKIADAAKAPFEVWKNPGLKGIDEIHIEHPEFTALCPRSGYPDSGTIVVDYVPCGYVCELKAFKLYVNSFRNMKISHEAVAVMIADKFMSDVKPIALRVILDPLRRGGVKTIVTIRRGSSFPFAQYKAGIL